MISQQQQEIIAEVLKPYSPKSVGVFGSYSRGKQTSQSDLDLLVDFNKNINLFDLIGIEMELTEKLGIKVDLVTNGSLSPLIRQFVEKDLKLIA